MSKKENMNEIISVIIPVYNVKPYLCQCLDSVLSQNYPHLEIILIDDGSTDGSESICDEFEKKDCRIKVIHQKNGGAAAAKNVGLRIATGKYLSFVDSDDFLEASAYSHMIDLLRKYEADVVQCSYRDVFRNDVVEHVVVEKRKELFADQYLELYTKNWTCGLLWDKLYVRSIFDDVFFEEGHKIDDEYFTYQGIMNASKIIIDNRIVYNYRKRQSSVMYSPESRSCILKDRIDYLSKRRINVIRHFPKLRKTFDSHFIEMMIILAKDPLSTKESRCLIREQLSLYFKEKDHTRIDFRLRLALVKLYLGIYKTEDMIQNNNTISTMQYFD